MKFMWLFSSKKNEMYNINFILDKKIYVIIFTLDKIKCMSRFYLRWNRMYVIIFILDNKNVRYNSHLRKKCIL